MLGKIYDIQNFSVHDGPGVRTTVFLKGCPLKCPWCHSPESQSFHTQMSYTSVRCIGTDLCGECLKVCPSGALSVGQPEAAATGSEQVTKVVWSRAKCIQCGACAQVCFPEALSLCGTDYSVEEVMDKLRKEYNFFRSSENSDKIRGGVTVSGGEPLCQVDFTAALLKAVHSDGIHTALDTTGFVPSESILRVLPYTDLFLYDLKHMDSAEHKRIMGVPNELILSNARLIADNGGKLQIRIPIIPTYNDSIDNLNKTLDFCESLNDAIELVQLLPYHHFGASKYERMQMYDPMPKELEPPSDEIMHSYLDLALSRGLPACIH